MSCKDSRVLLSSKRNLLKRLCVKKWTGYVSPQIPTMLILFLFLRVILINLRQCNEPVITQKGNLTEGLIVTFLLSPLYHYWKSKRCNLLKLNIASIVISGEVNVWGRCLVGLVSVVKKYFLQQTNSGGDQKGARFVSWSRRLRLYHQNP